MNWRQIITVEPSACGATPHMASTMNWRQIITVEPSKRSGKPCVRGMRLTVGDVLGFVATYGS